MMTEKENISFFGMVEELTSEKITLAKVISTVCGDTDFMLSTNSEGEETPAVYTNTEVEQTLRGSAARLAQALTMIGIPLNAEIHVAAIEKNVDEYLNDLKAAKNN